MTLRRPAYVRMILYSYTVINEPLSIFTSNGSLAIALYLIWVFEKTFARRNFKFTILMLILKYSKTSFRSINLTGKILNTY